MRNRLFARVALLLVLLELALVVGSWALSVLLPSCGVRSILTGGGVRWFVEQFMNGPCLSVLVWLAAWLMAIGCAARSGIGKVFSRKRPLLYRERTALGFSAIIIAAFVISVSLLTLSPQAALLNVSGGLFPSPFSTAIVPATALCVCVVSMVYGLTAGRFQTLTDIYLSLIYGMEKGSPLFLFYFLLIQLHYSLLFILG